MTQEARRPGDKATHLMHGPTLSFFLKNHTWLDLFIVKSAKSVAAYRKLPAPFIAGHDFIYIALSFKKAAPIAKSTLTRSLMKVSPDALHQSFTRTLDSVDDFTCFRLLRAEASNALDTAKNHHIATLLSDAPSAEAKCREIPNLRIKASTTTLNHTTLITSISSWSGSVI